MKKYVTLSLFIFWAITVAVITAGLITYNKGNRSVLVPNTNNPNLTSTTSGSNPSANKSSVVLTMKELAKHNSSQSCWLLISGKIYDVTSFLNLHPGNASTILPTCGTDATKAYNTKGSRGRPHSSSAQAMLNDYFIGNLNQTISTNSTNPTNLSASNPNTSLTSNEENDD
jgi:cytochrome b involved in lipid metabolism